ncbi:DUF3307 domain-containing protein [Virgisporangium aurantiacum]|uniref:DUF3307 domain-containing protein n=1 Tax=Virgisporangium aurantiacum TaxID=175570 RepID=A0A8J3Z751_9ACTN|nr:DUF3307 domain-containing protein [Virgisporangium aurantiacum]GIJ58651.1 hypothetical protein Vau01_061670 [Virgisporangium aurantiacum]
MSTAATAAITFVALYAGHQIGDHVVQTNAVAATKGAPSAEQLAAGVSPWAGWAACLKHVASYTGTQAVALAVVWVVSPLGPVGAAAALLVSASTHAVIDRRWLVRRLIRAKGCHDWREGPYLIDQSLHMGALLVASVLGAAIGGVGILAVAAGAVALIAAALAAERWLGAAEYPRSAAPVHG